MVSSIPVVVFQGLMAVVTTMGCITGLPTLSYPPPKERVYV